jgi:YVTN family beta-propeller protein
MLKAMTSGHADTASAVTTVALGEHVRDIAVSPAGDHVYLATTGSVTVLTGLHHLAGTIPVGPDTKCIIPGADGAFLYVIDYDGALSVITTADHGCRTVAVPPSSCEAVSPDGTRIHVARSDRDGSWISAVDADATLAATVRIDDYATGMDLSPDGSLLYVATSRCNPYTQYFPGLVSVIDTATYTVVDTIDVPLSPSTVTASPDGPCIFVTHYDTGAISAVDTARHGVISVRLPDAPLAAALTPDGTQLYVTGLQSLAVVDIATGVTETIAAGELPRRLLFSEDGKRAYLSDFGRRAVVLLDTITRSVITTVGVAGNPEALALTGDGQRLYAADYWGGTLTTISLAEVMRDAEES